MISVWGVVIFIDWQGHPFQNLPKIPGSVWIRPAKSAFSVCVKNSTPLFWKFRTLMSIVSFKKNKRQKSPYPALGPKALRLISGLWASPRRLQDPSYSEPWYKAVRGLEASNGNEAEAGYANSGAGSGSSSLEVWFQTNGFFFGLGWLVGWCCVFDCFGVFFLKFGFEVLVFGWWVFVCVVSCLVLSRCCFPMFLWKLEVFFSNTVWCKCIRVRMVLYIQVYVHRVHKAYT